VADRLAARLLPLLQGVLVRRRGVALGPGGGAAGLGADVAGGLARAVLNGALVRVASGLVWQRDADPLEAVRAGFGTVTPATARPANTSGISATAIPALATKTLRERGRPTVRLSVGTVEARAAAARRGASVLPKLGSGWVGTAARSALSKRATSFISLS
jgi:hypothetical protein